MYKLNHKVHVLRDQQGQLRSQENFIESNKAIHLHRRLESRDILSEVVASIVRYPKPFSTRQFLQNQEQNLSMLPDRSCTLFNHVIRFRAKNCLCQIWQCPNKEN